MGWKFAVGQVFTSGGAGYSLSGLPPHLERTTMVTPSRRAVTGATTPLRRRALAFGLAVTLLGIAGISGAMADPTAPSEEEIQAARQAEDLAALDVAQVEVQLASLNV